MSDDAVDQAVDELRAGGVTDEAEVARYRTVLASFAGYGWSASHLRAAARGLAERRGDAR